MTCSGEGRLSGKCFFVGLLLFLLVVLFITIPMLDRNFNTTFAPNRINVYGPSEVWLFNRSISDVAKIGTVEVKTSNAFGKLKKGKRYLLIYNNVPKCGSRSFAKAIKDTLKHRRPRVPMTRINKEDRWGKKLLQVLKDVESPGFATGHMPFIQLNRTDTVYINVVRDPLERYVSGFYFARNGDNRGVHPDFRGEKNVTIDEYFQNKKEFKSDTQLTKYFIEEGTESDNEEVNLARAKSSIEKHFTLVGISEEMEEMTSVLEKVMPDLLAGLHEIYRRNDAERREQSATKGKIPPSEKTTSILKVILKYDFQLYEFIKQKFHEVQRKYMKDRQ